MWPLVALFLSVLSLAVHAAERPLDVDPNTKIEGGADLRGSGANAGAGARTDNKGDVEPRAPEERGSVARPDKTEPDKDKPISERKPQERELEDASKGATKPQQ